GDPQGAELPLALTPVAVRVLSCLHHPLVGDAEGLAAHVVITLRLRQHLLVAGPGGDTTLYSGHRLRLQRISQEIRTDREGSSRSIAGVSTLAASMVSRSCRFRLVDFFVRMWLW